MAATINWITYVGGQWWGFACTADREQTRRFLLCLFCIDSLSEADLDRIMSTTEHNLLKSIMAFDHHILRPILLDSPISRVDLISTGSLFQASGAPQRMLFPRTQILFVEHRLPVCLCYTNLSRA